MISLLLGLVLLFLLGFSGCLFLGFEVGYLTAEQYSGALVGDVFLCDIATYILSVVILGCGTATYQYLLDVIYSCCRERRHAGEHPDKVWQSVCHAPIHKA